MEQIRRLFQEGALFLLALVRPAARSVRENVGLAALSVVLAFVLWIFVTDTGGGTTRSGTLPDVLLEVEPVNVPRGLTVAGDIAPVGVRVEVDEDVWEDLREDDFEATVDLAALSEGTHTVAVEVEALTSRGRLEVLGPVPSEGVEVTLVPLFSKSVPVEVQLQGALPAGLQTGDPMVEQDTVTVLGTEELVGLVSKAVAEIDVSGASNDINRSFPLEARDERGLRVKGVTLDPPNVNITVPIERKVLTRVLTVTPEVTGTPADGYNVVSVRANPSVVTVSGPRELLDSLSLIRTEEVRINGAREDVIRTVSLQVPAGVSLSGEDEVLVSVSIEPARGEARFGVTPEVVGLATELQVVGTLPVVEVTLTGPLPLLRGLIPGDLDVRLDLSGLSAGAHTVLVEVEAPAETFLISVEPSEMQVLLEAP